MTHSSTRNRNYSLTTAVLSWLIAPSVCSAALFVDTDTDPSFFPASAEVIAATMSQGAFGDDASTSLAQSFTVNSAFSLETIYLGYENDNNANVDQTLTLTIFNVTDVQAATHDEPPLAGDVLFTDTVTFPAVGGTDTVAGIHMDSPLALAAGGYAIRFSDTTSPGWEWLRTGNTDNDVYAGGHGYENGAEKGTGTSARDFTLALSSVALPPPPLEPIDTFSVQSGDLLAATTWDNSLAPVGTPPEPNYIHNVVSGHAVTSDGSQPYTGAEVNLTDGSLTYTASGVHLPLVTAGAGTTVNETTTGAFFLGDIGAPELGQMELNGQLTIAAEGGNDAGLDMAMSGAGTATVNVEAGGTLFLTDMSSFDGTLQFNGTGDEVLYEGPDGGGVAIEMNSTGTNRLALNPNGFNAISSGVVFNQPGEIDHRSDGSNNNNNRLAPINSIVVSADVTIDLTKTYARSGVPNERRLFAANGLRGSSNIIVNGTSTDPTTGDATLNEFEFGSTSPDSSTATNLNTNSYTGTLTANDFVNVEVRHHIPSAAVVVNQNARLEFGHRDVESLFTTRAGEVTVNSGGILEVGYEEQPNGATPVHAPYRLQLTKQRGESGDLTLATGSTTIMQISASGANQFDTIAAEGTVTLGGTLELLINPDVPSQTVSCDTGVDCVYTPTDGDMFEIISIVAETLPTDLDGNGSVGSEDIAIWNEMFGSNLAAGTNGFNSDVTADVDGDGDTDGADLLAIQRDFGAGGTLTGSITGDFDQLVIVDPANTLAGFDVTRSVTASSVILTINAIPGVNAVPEPSAVLLAGLAAMLMGIDRRGSLSLARG
jgi:hypothetical protein